MREIKFRGKTKDGWFCDDIRGYWSTNFYADVDPNTFGQYTGLKDNNGVEIYEGDIVVVTNLMADGFGEQMLASIVYDEELACFDFKASDRQRCVCTTILDVELEVIGNIHENPELLKEDERK